MNIFMAAGHEDMSVWEEAWSIFTDPSHIMAELGWTVIQDVVLIWLLYGTLWKKVILRVMPVVWFGQMSPVHP